MAWDKPGRLSGLDPPNGGPRASIPPDAAGAETEFRRQAYPGAAAWIETPNPASRCEIRGKRVRYWWVNQNQTYKREVEGGFLWSPKTNRDGRRNRFYDNMTEVSPGDLVLSFCDTEIKAIGIATGSAVSAEKPNFANIGGQWENEGWTVPVEFEEVVPIVISQLLK